MTGPTVNLPRADGSLAAYPLSAPRVWPRPDQPLTSRLAYAAAHVVADPLADNTPGAPAVLDWDATLAFRRHLWSYGLGVADAMDTAQRGMGLTWETTVELIRRSGAEAAATGGLLACGAGTDQLPPLAAGPSSLEEVVGAYEGQLAVVEDAGARPILMASRHLAAAASGADDYAKVYGHLLSQVRQPAILHWLGPMFDPALAGYWGSADLDTATETFLAIVRDHAANVDGVKVSLLDEDHEVRLRSALPPGVHLYTGDDFNYPRLIRSGSDALLGIFDAIAPAAAAALAALDAGDEHAYDDAFGPTVALSRHLFSTPTYYYKTGICFLAWLSGHQDGFVMVGGLQSARSVPHLVEAFRLADKAGLLPDPDLAATRMRDFLTVQGIGS
ncbi:dihydrodipicolinate synthase family protein [Actinopolymorpha alba]|uniref:dihydrodipicolinate synthase family protein n=1 Tax=Actinopolymorpha alba TaxID=533267 RepID=UPI00036D93CD|nr:dihydrodipicolinate synthase family protein [Actinopolymorpha alba]